MKTRPSLLALLARMLQVYRPSLFQPRSAIVATRAIAPPLSPELFRRRSNTAL
ncbi:MAG TPA: hypothetical protein VIN08_07615 [Ohtaekwangia sp.]|uniref:hypothetical protein n=1 Tax=Ohtaekwangia sp. TaxID=2066019 RepID=UPI002F9240CC